MELITCEVISVKYYECVFVFPPWLSGIQIASSLHCVILSFVADLPGPYFSTLSHKRHNFEKTILNIMCVLIFFTTFVWNISHSKKNFVRYYHKFT
jgi:hypothetical protein